LNSETCICSPRDHMRRLIGVVLTTAAMAAPTATQAG
jgi:hypothetical protein